MNEQLKTYRWHIGGMDCANCAAKIENVLQKQTAISDIAISVMTETLSLTLDTTTLSPENVMKDIRALGYSVGPLANDNEGPDACGQAGCCAASNAVKPPKNAWYQMPKGRQVVLSGLLVALAWGLKLGLSEQIGLYAFILATMMSGVPVARKAFAAARAGMPFTIEMLMTIAAIGAMIIGAAEEAALVIFLFAVGEMLEGQAADKARASIRSLANLVPKTAQREREGQVEEIPANALAIGETILVRSGDRIPADGTIISGEASVDEAPVTGESVPKAKEPGAPVFAGSINLAGTLRVRVEKTAADNTIARIITLVEEAQSARAPTERFIDRFSRYYMPVIVGLAMLVAILPPLVAGEPFAVWLYRALALLLIGCPCALVISVPASIASALSTGARQGLLVKGGAVIEHIAKTSRIAFDKTGTLTNGQPRVTDSVVLAGEEKDALALAAALEVGSNHPLAKALLDYAEAQNVDIRAAAQIATLAGRGVQGTVEGRTIAIVSPVHAEAQYGLATHLKHRIETLEEEGKTVVILLEDNSVRAYFALRDEPRDDAEAAMKALAEMNIQPIMLTGDNQRAGSAIAGQLGMDYRAELLPEDKVAHVQALSQGENLLMVGDGINDAPALASATAGIAMGSGADVALETADGAILRNRLQDCVQLIRLSRATMGNIWQNIALALGLKAVFLVTSIMGLTGLWLAILADTGATVLVTLNALRLLRFR